MWHERYYSLNTTSNPPLGLALPANCASVQFPGSHQVNNYVGSYQTGHIYIQSLFATSDDTRKILRQRVTPHMTDRNRWVKCPSFELDADVGTAAITLDYSNDGGRTFNPWSYTQTGSNDQGGAFERFKFWQLGRSRDRVWRVTSLDDSNVHRWVGAYVGVEDGTEP
jgi:hypothetical protein